MTKIIVKKLEFCKIGIRNKAEFRRSNARIVLFKSQNFAVENSEFYFKKKSEFHREKVGISPTGRKIHTPVDKSWMIYGEASR